MANEIERKFIIKGEFKHLSTRNFRIVQAYLSSTPERTVRIRIKANKAFITIKGISSANGLTRYEWEKEIQLNEAEELLLLCEPGKIDKTRYEVVFNNQLFEVDEFHDTNRGLILAEIELASESQPIDKPDWLGKEVTGDKRYYNSYLSSHPYSEWATS